MHLLGAFFLVGVGVCGGGLLPKRKQLQSMLKAKE